MDIKKNFERMEESEPVLDDEAAMVLISNKPKTRDQNREPNLLNMKMLYKMVPWNNSFASVI